MKYQNLALTAIILVLSSNADAAPVQWLNNGHLYEVIDNHSVITWQDASAQAQVAGGYLVTITSSAENDFVFSLLGDSAYWDSSNGSSVWGPWLGGFQSNGDVDEVAPDADWQWVTGEAWSYTNWHAATPNQNGDEDYLHYYYWLSDPAATPTWNDLLATGTHTGVSSQVTAYVVEYETSAVPVPAAVWLFGSGLLGFIGLARGKVHI